MQRAYINFNREILDRCVQRRKPGAFHNTRSMSSVIDAAKMYLLRDSIGYNEETTVELKDICLFNALVHFKHWLACPFGVTLLSIT